MTVGHGVHTEDSLEEGLMPGLATPQELEELRSASGVEAERIFLELMITHHLAAVQMSEAALQLSDTMVVWSLASGIVKGQEAEMDFMERMLDERQQAPRVMLSICFGSRWPAMRGSSLSPKLVRG